MSNIYCFLDESFRKGIFCLGGILVEESEMRVILESWKDYKTYLGLSPNDFIKWSLGDKEEVERSIKDTLKNKFRDKRDWLVTFRKKTLNKITSFNLTLFASLHQDVRISKSKPSPVDFYLWAFEFILQRIWRRVKDSDYTVFVIIDKPPESKRLKPAEKKIFQSYKKAYEDGFTFENFSIPPLKNSGFFESIFITKSDFSTFIQISDFVVGAIVHRAKVLLENKSNPNSRKFLQSILPKFYRERGEIIGKGLVVFPPNRKLLSLIQQDVNTITEQEENDLPF